MNRDEMVARGLARREPWDFVIIGGGATGLGIAVDAAARGYEVLLLEQHDFGKGTSSRSTKLIHGGVRYLRRGEISLVRSALRERRLLRQNAPHLVHDLEFIIPIYRRWDTAFYGLGLKVYDLLAGREGFGPSRRLSREETIQRLPSVRRDGLRGGVLYHDGQFDDARLLVNLAQTAVAHGATILNYVKVTALVRQPDGSIGGVNAQDQESGREELIFARVVVNATGAFCDSVRHMADPTQPPIVAPSQGIHLVFDGSLLQSSSALMIPSTPDGRVMFAIPWHGHTLVGTTDVAIDNIPLEPRPTEPEIDYLLEIAARYFNHQLTRADVLSTFAGVRPLIKPMHRARTAALARDHTIRKEPRGLVTITGGKWTTYRYMAEDCVDQAARHAKLDPRRCATRSLAIHGSGASAENLGSLALYGSDAPAVAQLAASEPALGERLHASLPYLAAEVVWAARFEMARTVEDVLARRTRALFLNARAAQAMAPRVAQLLARELNRDDAWQSQQVRTFAELARGYQLSD